MDTIFLILLFIIDMLLLWWWLNRKLNSEESYHSYSLYVYNTDGSFKRVEGIPDLFSVVESAEEHFGDGAQKIIVSENGMMKRLFTRQDYETGLCIW
jgi:hypothetical protein